LNAEVIAKLKQGYRFFGPPGVCLMNWIEIVKAVFLTRIKDKWNWASLDMLMVCAIALL